jgi:Luciferase
MLGRMAGLRPIADGTSDPVARSLDAMPERGTAATITEAVMSWPGVDAAPHRFGGVEFRLGRRELGHLHGDRIADLPFPRRVRDELIAAGRARPHHVLPDTGWITVPIASPTEAQNALELFRMAYDRARAARRTRRSSPRSTTAR